MNVNKNIPALDGVRGLAALMVMWFHYFQIPEHVDGGHLSSIILKFNMMGQTGVDLFFVLSGFLITRILINNRDGPSFFKNFYIRRVLRILPLYYFFLIIYLFIQPVILGEKIHSMGESWWWFVYLQNMPLTFDWPAYGPGHYWSLAVEEHFYLFWPLIVYFFKRRFMVCFSVFLILFSFLFRLWLQHHGIDSFNYTLTRLDALSFGALLALFEPSIAGNKVEFKKIFIISFSCVTIGLFLILFMGSISHTFWVRAVKFPVVGMLYFSLLGFILSSNGESLMVRFLSLNFMRFIGSVSFGLYVYHIMVFFWFDRFVSSAYPLLTLPLVFSVVIFFAYLSFKYFEAPILRLKVRFQGSSV